MYLHYDTQDENISLHDCDAERASFEDGVLTFEFGEGFWICPGHPDGTTEKVVRTDASRVEYYTESGEKSDICVYVFTRKGEHRAIREEWPIDRLIDSINSGRFTLEFLYQYKGYNFLVIDCWLRSDKRPYHRDCELRMNVGGVKYCWNRLREDCEW